MTTGLVIGAGPAGLMAAEAMAKAGLSVTVADRMPSPARKFLMAGKSGLNLTKNESTDAFLEACGDLPEVVVRAVRDFGPAGVMRWAEDLGQPTFTGSTGRVFPVSMKASPLTRAWLARLAGQGVSLQTRATWTGWDSAGAARFDTAEGPRTLPADAVVLALGGASWARLGSDGAWANHIGPIAPFRPANMGFFVEWSDHMTRHLGTPVKGIALSAGPLSSRGELVLSNRGIEGGGIYDVSRAMREGAPLRIDLKPDWSLAKVQTAMAAPRGRTTLSNHLRKVLRLDPVKLALLNEFGRPFPDDLAPLIKSLDVRHQGPRSMDEASSTAGGKNSRTQTCVVGAGPAPPSRLVAWEKKASALPSKNHW